MVSLKNLVEGDDTIYPIFWIVSAYRNKSKRIWLPNILSTFDATRFSHKRSLVRGMGKVFLKEGKDMAFFVVATRRSYAVIFCLRSAMPTGTILEYLLSVVILITISERDIAFSVLFGVRNAVIWILTSSFVTKAHLLPGTFFLGLLQYLIVARSYCSTSVAEDFFLLLCLTCVMQSWMKPVCHYSIPHWLHIYCSIV